MSSWLPIIGLEVHVELRTKSKMFCSCRNQHFRQKPNTHVCPVCLGFPGTLPVPNYQAIENTLLIALAFDCKINRYFWFDRKNYFYPDLPKGYQISQHFKPIGVEGQVPILVENKIKKIELDNIHLEEDTGKLIHTATQSLIDFNRSGVPLVEIVSKPCLHSGKEAKIYLRRLQQVLRWLEVSDCDMEKGSMRLEANISVAPASATTLPNYRVEIKNLNSFRFVEKAINYEIERQIRILKQGKKLKPETRGFDPEKGKTYPQRSKEVAKDYRYFPEPDIPPFEFSWQQIKKIEQKLPKMPWEWEKEMIEQKIPADWITTLSKDKKIIQLYWECVQKGNFSPREIAKFLVNNSTFRNKTPAVVLEELEKEKGKFSLAEKEIERLVQEVLQDNPQAIADFRKGKTQVVGFLIGQVQKRARGKADPQKTAELIKKKIKHF